MPMLPMGFTEFAELELEHVSTSQDQQGLVGGMLKQSQIKAKGAVRKPKTEFVDSPDHQLGVRHNVKFKKPMVEPGQSTSWLAMMETEAGFLLSQQQSDQVNAMNPLGNASSINLNATTTPVPTNTTSRSNGEKKTSSSVNKGETSGRKYYPAPYCSCTGTNQQCYRWGNGGWQSACCTTKISMYPLPMNPKKKGSRVAGRKMSAGAFSKLLDRLAGEGVDVNSAVDLRPHWAKHGTNRYVTIK